MFSGVRSCRHVSTNLNFCALKLRQDPRLETSVAIYQCSSPNTIRVYKPRRTRLAEHVARMGERRGAYRVLVGTLEGKIALGSHR
jgi:hypothetical protein